MALASPTASVNDTVLPKGSAALVNDAQINDAQINLAQINAALIRLAEHSLAEANFRSAATVLCTDLAVLLSAARVSLGWLGKGSIQIIALSNSGSAELESEQSEMLGNAMHEAIDQADTLQCPAPSTGLPARRIVQAQQVLTRATQGSVLTVPLAGPGRISGALVIEFSAIDPITPDLVQLAQRAAQIMTPVLALLREREAPWYQRLRASPTDRRIDAARTRMRRYLIASALALVLAALLVPINHSVSAPARIEGEVQRVVAAPIKGYLKAVKVRPGDRLKAGQLMAELGERDLELERAKFKSEIAQHEGAGAAAFAKGDRAAMSMSHAKADEARAQLGLVDHQLEQIQLTAPIDGVLIQGDLAQSIGAPVDRGQTLFTIAPVDRFRVIVELDERDVRAVSVGQRGELALSAMPWDTLAVSVKRIAPMATIVENRNVFELETVLSSAVGEIRPGLRGTVHLSVGQSTLLMIWGTRAINTLKRWSWRWTP